MKVDQRNYGRISATIVAAIAANLQFQKKIGKL